MCTDNTTYKTCLIGGIGTEGCTLNFLTNFNVLLFYLSMTVTMKALKIVEYFTILFSFIKLKLLSALVHLVIGIVINANAKHFDLIPEQR